MRVYKRPTSDVWYADINTESGRIRRSTGQKAKKDALKWASDLERSLRKDAEAGGIRMSWQDAVVQWVEERQDKRSLNDDIAKFRWLSPWLEDKNLDDIDRPLVRRIAEAKAKEASQATANRYIALIQAILNRAYKEWGTLSAPVAFTKFRESNERVRYLTPEEAIRLLTELPEHLSPMVAFALMTGLRAGNVSGLKWRHIDLTTRCCHLPGSGVKSGNDLTIPLNDAALDVLSRQVGRHSEYVFSYRGQPIRQPNTKAFREALRRAGIENFRFHDLRHTFASWAVQSGASIYEVQKLLGHSSTAVTERYAHLNADHLRTTAGKVGTKLAQSENLRGSDSAKSLISMVGCIGFEPMTDGLRVRQGKKCA